MFRRPCHGFINRRLGLLLPLVRSIVSVPAGMEEMPIVRFTVLTAIGSAIWNAVFIFIGYQLGENWDRVEGWVAPASYVVVALLAVALVWLILRKRRQVAA